MTSSNFSINAVVPLAAFQLQSGTPKKCTLIGDSGTKSRLKFCGDCGGALWTEWPGWSDIRILKAGILDGAHVMETDEMRPKAEQFTARRPDWLCPIEGADQFEGQQDLKVAKDKINEMEGAK